MTNLLASIHEAGHVVAAYHLGIIVTEVEIFADGTGLTSISLREDGSQDQVYAVFAVAGLVAEGATRSHVTRVRETEDYGLLAQRTGERSDDDLGDLMDKAKALVRGPWFHEIWAFAQVLEREGKLTGERIAAVLMSNIEEVPQNG